ncbi:uncharacterized protein LOC116302626 [Actinia tenebrosa]|uniref:Uncharacterized protein LOC116302626 n=1 Tax=Actinia tenebrosa TaxID=6105 RepID=A0A6P8IN72_ACTTE|nr:uncharacterized protein LOC116302626 [Actinia tenebrosa]
MRSVINLFVLLLLLLLLFRASEGAYVSELGKLYPCVAPCTDYGIVITPQDKPHTLSISVYKFSLRKDREIKPTDIKKIKTTPSEVPIDYDKVFSGNVSIGMYILPLVKAAEKAIPRDQHLTSPILFSVNERLVAQNPFAWFKQIGEINLVFANKTVPFLVSPFSVDELKAHTEALFKWQLINFLIGDLSSKTVGVLSFNSRMGSEVSFEKRVLDQSVTDLTTIAGISHAVVTSNFFRKGDILPLNTYLKAISSPRKAVIESPCGPKGVKKRFKGLRGVKWIVGTGDIEKCRSIIRRVLLSICDKINGCAYLKEPIKGKIIGYPDVGETMKQLGYDSCAEHLTPAKLDAAIRRVCGGNGKAAKGGKSSPRVIFNCVNGNFLYLMLTKGYKMKDSTSIEIKNEIAGLKVDTSLGELLMKMKLLD